MSEEQLEYLKELDVNEIDWETINQHLPAHKTSEKA